jgi:hypothetical protein
MKTRKNLSHDSQCLGQHSNCEPPACKCRALPIHILLGIQSFVLKQYFLSTGLPDSIVTYSIANGTHMLISILLHCDEWDRDGGYCLQVRLKPIAMSVCILYLLTVV